MKTFVTVPALIFLLAATADYTKIANNGWELPSSASLGSGAFDWACTRDNATGLIWEVKTDDGGLRDKDNTYTVTIQHYQRVDKKACHPRMILSGIHEVKIWIPD